MARARIGRSGMIAAAAALLAVFAVAVFAGVSFSSSSRVATAGVGTVAPSWAGTSLDGARLSSGTFRGRYVVLNFFATWCEGCRQETPALEAFAAGHPAAEVEVVSVLHADSAADARRFVRAHAVPWPIVSGGADTIASAFHLVGGLPQTEVIAPNGRILTQLAGAVTKAQLDRVVPVRTR